MDVLELTINSPSIRLSGYPASGLDIVSSGLMATLGFTVLLLSDIIATVLSLHPLKLDSFREHAPSLCLIQLER